SLSTLPPLIAQRLINQGLNVSLLCWTFDFIGTNPEESIDDVSVVHVPQNWNIICEDARYVGIYFALFNNQLVTDNDKAKCLQIIAQFVSVRTSIFSSTAV
ncbi:MAG: hypothetical protein EZS28_051929, partial [Streblomastix strix]